MGKNFKAGINHGMFLLNEKDDYMTALMLGMSDSEGKLFRLRDRENDPPRLRNAPLDLTI